MSEYWRMDSNDSLIAAYNLYKVSLTKLSCNNPDF